MRVSRKRLLRLMREHGLLSPHRARRRSDAPHDRRIVTEAPNVIWATDATQIATVQDGKVWQFGVAEHWNAELPGWHVAKRGTRFEALQAVGIAVRNQFDCVDAGAARGLALRHDHGSNFMSDAFQKQIRSWGIAPSFDKCFFAGSELFFSCAWVTARRRAGREAQALPRSLHCRPSFAAPVRACLGPRGFFPDKPWAAFASLRMRARAG